jgi:hypothetical protein
MLASLSLLATLEWSHPVSLPISVVLNPRFRYSIRSSMLMPLVRPGTSGRFCFRSASSRRGSALV